MDEIHFQNVVIKDALNQHPQLTADGLALYKKRFLFDTIKDMETFIEERENKVSNSQNKLLNSYLEFCICVKYLRKLLSKKPKRYSSSILQQHIEGEVGCDVSKGIIIVAAFFLGISIEKGNEISGNNDYITVLPIRLVGTV